jgi:putative ABC transport system permease protein
VSNTNRHITPPQLPLSFFRWFCRPEIVEDIEGDLMEKFNINAQELGIRKARWKFNQQILSLFRPGIIRSLSIPNYENHFIMLRHNLRIAWRNSKRDKSTFIINLTGLSAGLACALLIFLWVNDELKVDRFLKEHDRIYQVMENVQQDQRIITRRTTAGPTAKALKEEIPEVEMAVTATHDRIGTYTLSDQDRNLKARGLYASTDYFRLFSYQMVEGNRDQVLADKKSIVISESIASSLFGTTENVVGKIIEWQHEKQYQVSGIFRDLTGLSSVQFDFVLTFEGFLDDNPWVTNWFNTAPQTFVLLREGTDIQKLNDRLENFVIEKTNGAAGHRKPFVTRYSDAYLYSHYENGVQSGGRIEYVKLFSVIAIFILIIACINFMNLSTARASRRIKEIGIKKTLGARRTSLIGQYLSESTLLAYFSLMIALGLVLLFLPRFNIITGKSLQLDLNPQLILSLLTITLLVGIFAGSYPALYLSGFKPVRVLKGKLQHFMGETWARRGLVVFQFVISIILISAVWVVYRQMTFIQTKNLGYQKDHIVMLDREGKIRESQESFLAALQNLPGVVKASAIGHNMAGHNSGTYGIEWPGKNPEDRTEFERVPVDYGMIELLGIDMVEGRSFSKEFKSDTGKIIFNQAAIEYMGISEPIGKKVKLWGREMEIAGVTNSFHFESFHEQIKPLFMWLEPAYTSNILIKIAAGREKETIANIQQFYQEFNPGFPFNYRFLDEGYQTLYQAEQKVSTLSKYFAGLAILISCLGLIGLSVFTAERRQKEIGIRKILGSGELNIVYLLSGDFTRMVMIAVLMALPVSYYLTTRWLDGFAFRIGLSWWNFLGAGALALLIAWVTISVQTFRAARINPIECLRNE